MTYAYCRAFLPDVVEEYGGHPVSTDGGTWYPPQACKFLKLEYCIHIYLRKALSKEQCNILNLEPKGLMIIFLVERRNGNSSM